MIHWSSKILQKINLLIQSVIVKTKPIFRFIPLVKTPQWVGLDEDGQKLLLCQTLELSPLAFDFKIFDKERARESLKRYQKEYIACCADLKSTLLQDLHLSVIDPKTVREVLPYQLEPILPFPIEKALIAFYQSQINEKGCEVHVVCAHRERITEVIGRYQDFGLTVDSISSYAFASLAAHRYLFPKIESCCLYAVVRSESIWFILVNQQKIWGVREVAHSNVKIDTEEFEFEAKKTLLYLQAPYDTLKLVVGAYDRISEVFLSNYESALLSPLKDDKRHFFLCLGLCLLSTYKDLQKAHFSLSSSLSTNLIFLNKWRQSFKALIFNSIVLSSVFIILTSLIEHRQWQKTEERIHHLQQLAIENSFELPILKNKKEIDLWLKQTEEILNRSMSNCPLVADIPNAADALGWLSSLIDEHASGRLVNFDYKMETYPTPKHPHALYRVKVESEIEILDFEKAQKFQQALLQARLWIDQPHQLQWKAHKDRYKLSFYLKDRTHYGI
jgi:hypothetical protein